MRRCLPVLVTAILMFSGVAGPKAYVLMGPKWATHQVPYYIDPTNGDVSEAAAEAAVQQGASAWSLQSTADFAFYYMGRTSNATLANNGRNEVFFRNTSNGGLVAETYWWQDSSGRLLDADIIFYDGAYTFFTGTTGCSGGLYIEEFATHEFGHALGLAHSPVVTATMYPTGNWCSNDWRYLDPDDVAGVEALYPGGAQNTAPSLTVNAPTDNTSIVEGTSLTFSGSATDQRDGNLSYRITWASNLAGQLGVGASLVATLPAGTNIVTATVTDSAGLTTTKQVTVSVTSSNVSSSPVPPQAVITLSANAYKIRQRSRVDLTWSGATASNVDVYLNGARECTTANDGAYSDSPGRKASGTLTYKVCQAGSSVCSNTVSVVF